MGGEAVTHKQVFTQNAQARKIKFNPSAEGGYLSEPPLCNGETVSKLTWCCSRLTQANGSRRGCRQWENAHMTGNGEAVITLINCLPEREKLFFSLQPLSLSVLA